MCNFFRFFYFSEDVHIKEPNITDQKKINEMILNYISAIVIDWCLSSHPQRSFLWVTHSQTLCGERVYIRGLHQVVPLGALGSSQRMGKTMGI